jgi:hypothetical protein
MNTLAFDLAGKTVPPFWAQDSFMRRIASGVDSTAQRLPLRRTDSKRDHERVEFAFGTVALRSLCEIRRRATTVLGAEAARELAQRLADLSALTTVAELADLFPDDIVDRSRSERALRLQAGNDLVFCAGHVEVPVLEDGSTDWTRVSRIKILALEARHA